MLMNFRFRVGSLPHVEKLKNGESEEQMIFEIQTSFYSEEKCNSAFMHIPILLRFEESSRHASKSDGMYLEEEVISRREKNVYSMKAWERERDCISVRSVGRICFESGSKPQRPTGFSFLICKTLSWTSVF